MSEDPIFWAYVAGLMDSDGSFSIKKEQRIGRNIAVYSPVILLSMVDNKSVYHIVNNCSVGTVFTIKSRLVKRGYLFRFGVYGYEDVITFLKSCIPYLRIKRQLAMVLLKFCENRASCLGRTKDVPVQVAAFREQCYQEMKSLHNGVYKSSLIDLEPLTDNAEGNKGQAANSVQSERSKREELCKSKVCGALNSDGNTER